MEHKPIIQVKAAKGRQVEAIIATLHAKDADGDTIRDNFFPSTPLPALIVPAHRWEHYTLGKSWTYQQGGIVKSVLLFNNTPEADAWLESIAFDFAHPPALQQYSWGFKPYPDAVTHTKGFRELHGRPNGSHGIRLFEVSPVLQASSVGTMTTAIKSSSQARLRAIEERLERSRRWR